MLVVVDDDDDDCDCADYGVMADDSLMMFVLMMKMKSVMEHDVKWKRMVLVRIVVVAVLALESVY